MRVVHGPGPGGGSWTGVSVMYVPHCRFVGV